MTNQKRRVPDLTRASSISEFLQQSIAPRTNILPLRIPSKCQGDRRGKLQLPAYSMLAELWLTNFNCRFNQATLIDTTPLPPEIPPVQELGTSSAPLLSASFFIGARCKPYNDDFMQCKNENPGKGEVECLKEGRRVTRCAKSV